MSPASPIRQLSEIEAALPKERPPLHDIAAMPFPASMVAMRKFYNKDWHKPESDGESPGKWKVTVRYTERTESDWDVEVEAASQAEAEEKAEVEFDRVHKFLDCDVEGVDAEFLGGEA